MSESSQMDAPVAPGTNPAAGGGALASQDASVQFINGEVMAPPAAGQVTFMHPYRAQVAAMAMDDARNYIQGVEQVLLIAVAKFLATEDSNGLDMVQKVMSMLPEYLTKIAGAVPPTDQ